MDVTPADTRSVQNDGPPIFTKVAAGIVANDDVTDDVVVVIVAESFDGGRGEKIGDGGHDA